METRKNILILSSDAADTLALAPIGFSDAGQTPPEEFLLIRYGDNDYTKGEEQGKFAFSEADANEIIADFSKRGKDIVFDYEHQTLKGVEAPASGWIKSIAKGAAGLVAKVDWTERAAKLLQGREYRYHSPVLHFKAGRPYRLHSVALTNHPALHGYPALVADDNKSNKQEEMMNEHLKKIAAMLGVTVVALADGKEDEKATAEAVEAKIKALSDGEKEMQSLLGLHDCKTAEELTLKIKGMVPAAEKAELEKKLSSIEAGKAVAKAFSDGKLIEAQRDWAVKLAEKDLVAFNDFVAKAPKVAPGPASVVATANPPKAGSEDKKDFSDNQKTIFNRLGFSDTEVEAIKKEAK